MEVVNDTCLKLVALAELSGLASVPLVELKIDSRWHAVMNTTSEPQRHPTGWIVPRFASGIFWQGRRWGTVDGFATDRELVEGAPDERTLVAALDRQIGAARASAHALGPRPLGGR